MDALELLTHDHQAVEGLFKKFEDAGPRAVKTKQALAEEIIEELTVHTEIEEKIFYPAVAQKTREAKQDVLESIEEHHLVETLMGEIKRLTPEDEAFSAKMTVLIENVRHHKHEEEHDLFPKVRKAMPNGELETLGQQLHRAKLQGQGKAE